MFPIKLMLFNTQDLFVFMDNYQDENLQELNEYQWQKLTSSFYGNKELEKVKDIARAVLEVDPDILMLVEVGGEESLINFSRYFLNDQYQVFHAPSNSDRGIDTGYLVKKDLPFKIRLRNFSKVRLNNGKKPARGFLRLDLQKDDAKLAVILTHLKSKLDLKKEDYEGRGQRKAEVDFLIKMLREHPANYPLVIAGDLNGVIYKEETEEELKSLAQADMLDVLEHIQIPVDERFTYVYFNNGGNRFPMQLDYILVNKLYSDRIFTDESGVYRFKTESGIEMSMPDNRLQKSYFPSDHYPVVLSFMV
jgi:endonuclease/exonuclease/phosphatase family metal-dependent hydrolase